MRFAQGVKPASWLDDSFGYCLPIWYYKRMGKELLNQNFSYVKTPKNGMKM